MFGNKARDSEISFLRQQVRGLQERCDRLTEALGRKVDLPVIMPSVYAPPEAPVPSTQYQPSIDEIRQAEAEMLARAADGNRGVNAWARSLSAGGQIASAVKVSAPET